VCTEGNFQAMNGWSVSSSFLAGKPLSAAAVPVPRPGAGRRRVPCGPWIPYIPLAPYARPLGTPTATIGMTSPWSECARCRMRVALPGRVRLCCGECRGVRDGWCPWCSRCRLGPSGRRRQPRRWSIAVVLTTTMEHCRGCPGTARARRLWPAGPAGPESPARSPVQPAARCGPAAWLPHQKEPHPCASCPFGLGRAGGRCREGAG